MYKNVKDAFNVEKIIQMFHDSVRRGDVRGVEGYMQKFAAVFVNRRDEAGNTPLMTLVNGDAYHSNKMAIAEILLENGAAINAEDGKKHTAFYLAHTGRHANETDAEKNELCAFLEERGARLANGMDNADVNACNIYLWAEERKEWQERARRKEEELRAAKQREEKLHMRVRQMEEWRKEREKGQAACNESADRARAAAQKYIETLERDFKSERKNNIDLWNENGRLKKALDSMSRELQEMQFQLGRANGRTREAEDKWRRDRPWP